MKDSGNRRRGDDTICIHAGVDPSSAHGAVSVPIYQSSTFVFDSPEQGAARFKGTEPGYIYTRIANPTNEALARAIADLEGARYGLVTASGMAATSTLYFTVLNAGDHAVCSSAMYGPSRLVLEKQFSRFGVQSSYVDTAELEAIKKVWRPETKLLYVETPANPTLSITDIETCAKLAHKRGALLAVDNTFSSPILQKPFRFNADVVVHSCTKFLNGHADVVGGAILLNDEDLYSRMSKVLQHLGGTMDPHQAWLIHRGIKTLALRVRKAQENATAVADLLVSHPAVEEVRYPGLPGHKHEDRIKRQMEGPGALIAFDLKGGVEAGIKLLKSFNVITLAVSLGGVETLVQHPASMTHAGMDRESRLDAGIGDGLVRLSVGCEDVEDLLTDLKAGLDGLL